MDINKISFNDIPEVLTVILSKLDALEAKVDKLLPTHKKEEQQWFNVAALIDYLPNHPAEQTVYGWTSTHKIPYHKRGKSIMFNKAEIDEWLQDSTYHKSVWDLERDAEEWMRTHKCRA